MSVKADYFEIPTWNIRCAVRSLNRDFPLIDLTRNSPRHESEAATIANTGRNVTRRFMRR